MPPVPPADPFHAAFDQAIAAEATFYFRHPDSVRENLDLLSAFGPDNTLGREAFVGRYHTVLCNTFQHPHTGSTGRFGPAAPDRFSFIAAGGLLGWSLSRKLITEGADEAGERVWSLVRRDPTYVYVANPRRRGRFMGMQVLGLPPVEQAAMDRKRATDAKRALTLDRKARDAADNPIGRACNIIIEHQKGFLVPANWATRGPIPAVFVGRPLVELTAIVGDAHHTAGLDRAALRDWIEQLEGEVRGLRFRAATAGRRQAQEQENAARRQEQERGDAARREAARLMGWRPPHGGLFDIVPPPLPPAPTLSPVQRIPPEDEDALGSLV